jgi:TPP-dependent 2-oxoacid decarboxylase
MGFGLPAAMGAKVGMPEETVICVAGDGSVQMNMQELSTCSTEGIDVKVFIINNGYLGMVRQWQELFWDKRYSAVDMRPPDNEWPDFVKLAEAHGATGQEHADRRCQDGHRDTRSGRVRHSRHPRRERVPDDCPGRGRSGHGGLEPWAIPEQKNCCR